MTLAIVSQVEIGIRVRRGQRRRSLLAVGTRTLFVAKGDVRMKRRRDGVGRRR